MYFLYLHRNYLCYGALVDAIFKYIVIYQFCKVFGIFAGVEMYEIKKEWRQKDDYNYN